MGNSGGRPLTWSQRGLISVAGRSSDDGFAIHTKKYIPIDIPSRVPSSALDLSLTPPHFSWYLDMEAVVREGDLMLLLHCSYSTGHVHVCRGPLPRFPGCSRYLFVFFGGNLQDA